MRWRAKRRISWPGQQQMDADHNFQLDDAGGDLDEAQAQDVERDAPHRTAGVREKPKLIGGRLGAPTG